MFLLCTSTIPPSDLGSRGFGNYLRISNPQVETFRIGQVSTTRKWKAWHPRILTWKPSEGGVGAYHSTNEANFFASLHSNNTHQGEAWDGDDDGNNEEKRVAQLLNNDEINLEYKEAFRQQTIIGWEYIFTGNFAKGWRNSWMEHQQWPTKFAILMMKWDRACWSSRSKTLFGKRSNRYLIKQRRLMTEAKV